MKDTIVDEVHRIRKEISRENGDDIRAIARAAQAREQQSGHEVVSLEPRRIQRDMVLREEK